MGYYSWLETDLRLKQGLKKRFLAELEFQKGHCDSQTWDVLLYEMARLKGRRLIYDDPWSKWEGGLCFANFLASYVESGYLRFVGEDMARWGYHFDGHGNVFALTWREEVSQEPIIRVDSGTMTSRTFPTPQQTGGRPALSGDAVK